jgi:hypothetical protein
VGSACSALFHAQEQPSGRRGRARFASRGRRFMVEPLEQRQVLSATLAFDSTPFEQVADTKHLQVNYVVGGATTTAAFDIALVAVVNGSTVGTLLSETIPAGMAPGSHNYPFVGEVTDIGGDFELQIVLDPNASVDGSEDPEPYTGSFIDSDGVIYLQGTTSADSVTTTESSGDLSFTLDSVGYSYTLAGTVDQPAVTSLQARLREGDDTLGRSGGSVPLIAFGGAGGDTFNLTGSPTANATLAGGLGNNSYQFTSAVSGDYIIDPTSGEYGIVAFNGFNDGTSTGVSVDLGLSTQQTVHTNLTLTLDGSFATSVLVGTAWDDTLTANDAGSTLYGGSGNDILAGGAGNDAISGGEGNDVITSGGGDDLLSGESGEDTLTGGSGYNIMYGGFDDDDIYGGTGLNEIYATDYDGGEGGTSSGDDWIYPDGISYINSDQHDVVRWYVDGQAQDFGYSDLDLLLVNLDSGNHTVSVDETDVVIDGGSALDYSGADYVGIGGNSGVENVTVDIPSSGIPAQLLVKLAGGSDTLSIVGSSSDDTIVVGNSTVMANGSTIYVVDVENVNIDGGVGDDTIGAVQPPSGTLLTDTFTSDDYGNNTLIFTSGGSIQGGYSTVNSNTAFTAGSYTITGAGFRRFDLNAQSVILDDLRIDHYYDVDASSITLAGDVLSVSGVTPGDSFTLLNNVVGNALTDNNSVTTTNVAVGTLSFDPDVSGSNDLDFLLLEENFGDNIRVDAEFARTHHENLPRFAAQPTIWAIDDGSWFDPDTWSADRVPTDNDVVFISPGIDVDYDDESTATIKAIDVWGSLLFADDVDTALTVGTLTVLPLGTLQIGTAANPIDAGVTATLTIADQALDTSGIDPEQFGTALLGLGTIDIHGAAHAETWLELDGGLTADGDSDPDSIVFPVAVPTSWTVGQTLVLPDTRQPLTNWAGGGTGKYFGGGTPISQLMTYQIETVTIASISLDRKTITLAEDLEFDHLGQSYVDQSTQNTVPLNPHAALLTRNVLIHSENPTGTRGHTLFTGRADVDIEYAQFKDLGRTDNFPVWDPDLEKYVGIDNTTFDANGAVTHIGLNQIARYAVHFHHLLGPVNSNPSTPDMEQEQYHFIGNTVESSMKWAVTVHGTSFGVLEDNVVYGAQGAGFTTEDGSEIGNRFIHNFVVGMRGTSSDGELGNPTDFPNPEQNPPTQGTGGSGFWFRRMGNIVQDNVATDNSFAGYTITGYYPQAGVLPNFPGANPMTDGTSLGSTELNKVTYLPTTLYDYEEVFAGNEGYGMSAYGLWGAYTLGANNSDHGDANDQDHETLFTDTTFWNEGYTGAWIYHTNRVTFDGLVMVADPEAINRADVGNVGLKLDDYENYDTKVTDAHIEGYVVGTILPTNTNGRAETSPHGTYVSNAYLQNWLNVLNTQPQQRYGSSGIYVKFTDVTFAYELAQSFGVTPTQYQPGNFQMRYNPNPNPVGLDLTAFNVVQVEGFNFTDGTNTYVDEDFQVYFEAQDPDATYHQSREDWAYRAGNSALGITDNLYLGAPILADGDHDNDYYFDNYGAAFAGSIAPPDALDTTWDESALGVTGLVGSYKNPFTNTAAVGVDADFPNVDAHVQLITPWDGSSFEDQKDYGLPYVQLRYRIYGSVEDLIDLQNGPTEVTTEFRLIKYSDEQESSIVSDVTYTAHEDPEILQSVFWNQTAGHYKLSVYLADENGDELTNTSGSEATFDILPLIEIDSVPMAEGDSPDTTYFIFTVTLSVPKTTTLYVEYATMDGSAIATSGDYTATSGTLTFAPSATTAMITVAVTGDDDDEDDEDFSVVLSNPKGPSGYTFDVTLETGTYIGTGTITDDD